MRLLQTKMEVIRSFSALMKPEEKKFSLQSWAESLTKDSWFTVEKKNEKTKQIERIPVKPVILDGKVCIVAGEVQMEIAWEKPSAILQDGNEFTGLKQSVERYRYALAMRVLNGRESFWISIPNLQRMPIWDNLAALAAEKDGEVKL